MRRLKIIGIVSLGLWMAFVTWRIEGMASEVAEFRGLILFACGYEFAQYELALLERGGPLPEHPPECPWVHPEIRSMSF